jgi:hypothetical protein
MSTDEEGPLSPLKGQPLARIPVSLPPPTRIRIPSSKKMGLSHKIGICATLFFLLGGVLIGCLFGLTGNVSVKFTPLSDTRAPTRALEAGSSRSSGAPQKLSVFFTRLELCQDVTRAILPSDTPAAVDCIVVFTADSPLPDNPTEADLIRARPLFHDIADPLSLRGLSLRPLPLNVFSTGTFKYGVLRWEPMVVMQAEVISGSGLRAFTHQASENTSLLRGPAQEAWLRSAGFTIWSFGSAPFSVPISAIAMRGSCPLSLVFNVRDIAVAGNFSEAPALSDIIENPGFGFDAPIISFVPLPQTAPGSGGVPGVIPTSSISVEQYEIAGPAVTREEKEGFSPLSRDDSETVLCASNSVKDVIARARERFQRQKQRRVVNITSAPRLLLTLLVTSSNHLFAADLSYVGATNTSVFITRPARLWIRQIVSNDDGSYDFPPFIQKLNRLVSGSSVCRMRASALAANDGEFQRLVSDESKGADRLYNYSKIAR